MIIVATRCAFICYEVFAAVSGAIGRRLHDVNRVRVIGVDENAAEVQIPCDARVGCNLAPGLAAIVRTEQAGLGDREHTLATSSGSDSETNAAQRLVSRKTRRGEFLPSRAFVQRFIDPRVGLFRIVGRALEEIVGLPQCCIEHARIVRIGHGVCSSSEIVSVECFRPSLSAIRRFENAAPRTRRREAENGMAQRAYNKDVGIMRVNDDRIDVANVKQADMRPGRAGVGGFVHSVAVGLLASADVYDIWIRRSDCDRADRGDMLIVKNRFPDAARVGCLPYAAARRTHVIDCGIARDSNYSGDAARAVRSNQTPAHGRIETRVNGLGILLLGGQRRGRHRECKEDQGEVILCASQNLLRKNKKCITVRDFFWFLASCADRIFHANALQTKISVNIFGPKVVQNSAKRGFSASPTNHQRGEWSYSGSRDRTSRWQFGRRQRESNAGVLRVR